MSGNGHTSGWLAQGATARGASHVRSGTPNQDAIGWITPTAGLSRCAMVLSDGHGGKGHDLSHVGSRLAVECALAELAPLIAEGVDADAALAGTGGSLAARIHERWQRRIGEWHGKRDAETLFRHGATLVAVALGDQRLLALQIGDGDIVIGHADGTVARLLAADDGLIGEQTHSLCQLDAPRFARLAVITLDGGPAPVDFVMASTDGLMKSFADDAGFLDLARRYRMQIAAQGLGVVAQGLGEWLSAASASGSGDDISLGFLAKAHLPAGPGMQGKARHAPRTEGRPGRTRALMPVAIGMLAGAALAAATFQTLGWLQPPEQPVPVRRTVEEPAKGSVQEPLGPAAPQTGPASAPPRLTAPQTTPQADPAGGSEPADPSRPEAEAPDSGAPKAETPPPGGGETAPAP